MQEDNRIRVRVEPELQPVRYEDKMDLNSEIEVGVDTHMKGLGVAGLIAIAVGVLCVLIGAILYTVGYPEPWYANIADADWADSRALIERVMLLWGGGVVLLFFGTSAFFYGRTVLGSGRLDQFTTKEMEVET